MTTKKTKGNILASSDVALTLLTRLFKGNRKGKSKQRNKTETHKTHKQITPLKNTLRTFLHSITHTNKISIQTQTSYFHFAESNNIFQVLREKFPRLPLRKDTV